MASSAPAPAAAAPTGSFGFKNENGNGQHVRFKINAVILVALITLGSNALTWFIGTQSRSAVTDVSLQQTAQATVKNTEAISAFSQQYVPLYQFRELERQIQQDHAETQQELLEIRNELVAQRRH